MREFMTDDDFDARLLAYANTCVGKYKNPVAKAHRSGIMLGAHWCRAEMQAHDLTDAVIAKDIELSNEVERLEAELARFKELDETELLAERCEELMAELARATQGSTIDPAVLKVTDEYIENVRLTAELAEAKGELTEAESNLRRTYPDLITGRAHRSVVNAVRDDLKNQIAELQLLAESYRAKLQIILIESNPDVPDKEARLKQMRDIARAALDEVSE